MKRRLMELVWWLSDRAESLAWRLRDLWLRIDRVGKRPLDPVQHRAAIVAHFEEHQRLMEQMSGVSPLMRGTPEEHAAHVAAHEKIGYGTALSASVSFGGDE